MADEPVVIDVELRAQVVDTMTNLLRRILRLDHPVTELTNLMDELHLSSSQSAQLVLDLESDLSIMVDVEDLDAEEMCTVGDFADYVAGHSTPQ
jgi:acyl carrier protein